MPGEKIVTQPMEIVLVRHGQSAANVVQQAEKDALQNLDIDGFEEVYRAHDFQHHLTEKGVLQAKMARLVMLANFMAPEEFDEWYVSPFVRTQETAAYIGNGLIDWLPEIRIIERDWGLYGSTPMRLRKELFAETDRRREISSFHTRYEGGENIPDVITRVRDWLNTLNRDKTGQRILAVTHGELMWAARYVLEGMSPELWHEMDRDKSLRIGNCCILHYSRMNPTDPADVSPTMTNGWRRMTDPLEPEKSPYGGKWVKLPGRARLNGQAMLDDAEAYDRGFRKGVSGLMLPNES